MMERRSCNKKDAGCYQCDIEANTRNEYEGMSGTTVTFHDLGASVGHMRTEASVQDEILASINAALSSSECNGARAAYADKQHFGRTVLLTLGKFYTEAVHSVSLTDVCRKLQHAQPDPYRPNAHSTWWCVYSSIFITSRCIGSYCSRRCLQARAYRFEGARTDEDRSKGRYSTTQENEQELPSQLARRPFSLRCSIPHFQSEIATMTSASLVASACHCAAGSVRRPCFATFGCTAMKWHFSKFLKAPSLKHASFLRWLSDFGELPCIACDHVVLQCWIGILCLVQHNIWSWHSWRIITS